MGFASGPVIAFYSRVGFLIYHRELFVFGLIFIYSNTMLLKVIIIIHQFDRTQTHETIIDMGDQSNFLGMQFQRRNRAANMQQKTKEKKEVAG